MVPYVDPEKKEQGQYLGDYSDICKMYFGKT